MCKVDVRQHLILVWILLRFKKIDTYLPISWVPRTPKTQRYTTYSCYTKGITWRYHIDKRYHCKWVESKTFGVMQSCICNHTSHVALYTEVLLRKKSKKGALGNELLLPIWGRRSWSLRYVPKKGWHFLKKELKYDWGIQLKQVHLFLHLLWDSQNCCFSDEIAYKVLAMIDGHFVIGLEIQYFFQEAIADVTENLQNCNSMLLLPLLSWLWSTNFNNSKNSSLLHFVMSQITWSDSQ